MISKNPLSKNCLSFVASGDAEGSVLCERAAAHRVRALQIGGKNESRGALFVSGEKPGCLDHLSRVLTAFKQDHRSIPGIKPAFPAPLYRSAARYPTAVKVLSISTFSRENEIPLETVLDAAGQGLEELRVSGRPLKSDDVVSVARCTSLVSLAMDSCSIDSSLCPVWTGLGL